MQRIAILPALLLTVGSPTLAQDQAQDLIRQRYEEGLVLAAAGDTAEALMRLRWVVRAAPAWAAAQYQLGRLLNRFSTQIETDFLGRREAERALRRALELEPREPRYMAEIGILFVRQGKQDDGRRVLERALDLGRDGELDERLLADIHYHLGRLAERDYVLTRGRRLVGPTREPTQVPGYASWFSQRIETLDDPSTPVAGSGVSAGQRMAEHYREAMGHDPAYLLAAQRLLLHLLETGQMDEYLAQAAELVELTPERAESHLYLGLGLHAAGHEEESARAFERGIGMLGPEEQAPFDDLAPIMRRRRAAVYAALPDSTRARFKETFWRLGDPLFLTDANERQLEHWARVVYADLRFSEPRSGRRGWDTEAGLEFIRYGPAGARAVIATLPNAVQRYYASTGVELMREAREIVPATYGNITSIAALHPVPIQIARFRGASVDEVAVEIHAELPLEELARDVDLTAMELETGLYLMSKTGNRILALRDTALIAPLEADARNPVRSWRLLLPPAQGLLAGVETRDAITWRVAAGRDTFSAVRFGDSLSVSDILVAHSIRPLVEDARRRGDLDIDPSADLTLAPAEPLGLYYEIYGLEPDAEGFAGFDVALTVTVKSLNREGTILGEGPFQILAQLADAWGFSVVGDDRVELRFSRVVDMRGRDRTVEYQNLDLNRAPPGDYEVTVQVWDRLADAVVARARHFSVLRTEP